MENRIWAKQLSGIAVEECQSLRLEIRRNKSSQDFGRGWSNEALLRIHSRSGIFLEYTYHGKGQTVE